MSNYIDVNALDKDASGEAIRAYNLGKRNPLAEAEEAAQKRADDALQRVISDQIETQNNARYAGWFNAGSANDDAYDADFHACDFADNARFLEDGIEYIREVGHQCQMTGAVVFCQSVYGDAVNEDDYDYEHLTLEGDAA